MSDAARYYMIGGFLGAGKTTAVAALAHHLTTRRNLRVGLITNDQGSELVDTAMLRARGFVTEEIPGGCFCCRFNSLVDAARRLTQGTRPDAFVAEPVGSCTDLMATVMTAANWLLPSETDADGDVAQPGWQNTSPWVSWALTGWMDDASVRNNERPTPATAE